jgi:hypothetical protein
MRTIIPGLTAAVLLAATPLAVLAEDGILDQQKGKGGSEIQGGAGTSGSQGASADLQHCDKPLGAMAVVEPQDFVVQSLSRYNLGSPTSLIRLMIQQSNCFLVVERGVGMQNMMQERALAGSGELRQGSNMGGGQMVSADFILTPNVVFAENNAGGAGAALGGLFGNTGRVLGGIAGGLKFKEAQTSMLVADARSGLQVAAAEGSSKKADLSIGILGAGGGLAGAAGGYGSTNEGKVIAASLLDNYNNIVTAVRNDPNLQRDVGTLAAEAGKKTQAGEVFNEGDVLRGKLASVKLQSTPSDAGKTVSTLTKADEMIYMGKEQDGYVNVETSKGSGWVKKILVTR